MKNIYLTQNKALTLLGTRKPDYKKIIYRIFLLIWIGFCLFMSYMCFKLAYLMIMKGHI